MDLVTFKSDALCGEWWIDPESHVEFVGLFLPTLIYVTKNSQDNQGNISGN